MNKKQRTALLAGLIVAVAMAIFPPWSFRLDNSGRHFAKDAGYSMIFDPPNPPAYLYTVTIDGKRLLIQWAIVLGIVGAAWIKFHDSAS